MMSDISYKIDKKNKVVVCKLSGCTYIALDRIEKYGLIDYAIPEAIIPDFYYGVARCLPEDKFDEEYGKEIALTKAKAKRCKAINKALKKYIKRVRRQLDTLEKYGIHQVPEVELRD